MMQRFILIAFVAVALSSVPSTAHNWLRAPVTRNGNTDSQVRPCPPGEKAYTSVVRGASLSVTYKQNHGSPDHEFKIVAAANEAAMSPATVSVAYPAPDGNNPDMTRSIVIPADHVLGDHVVQYKWGSYYNCFDLIVSDPSLTLVSGDTYRLADDKGTVNLKTMAYTCDDGSTPVDDPNKPGLKACELESEVGPAFAFGVALITLCALGLLAVVGYVVFVRQTNRPRYDELVGHVSQWKA